MPADVIQKTQFASDNTAGMCPEAMDAYLRANHGSLLSYGDDALTERAANKFRELFETDCDVFFVFNGTASNALALASCCQSYHSIICHEHAHILVSECGAPEFFSNGAKVLGAPGVNGKLTPASIASIADKCVDIHYHKPRVVSLTQCTELSTVYQLKELAEIREATDRFKLMTHMDGARFANSVAALNVAPKAVTWQAGVDVLCFGGTKLGMANTEVVIFFDCNLAVEFEYRCKQAGQLASKMRFHAAPWLAMLENGVWLKHAQHANRCAALLASRLKTEANLTPALPVDANGVFLNLPKALEQALHDRGWVFYNFPGDTARLMCSWQTTEADINSLIGDVIEIKKAGLSR
jgi:threonine aldolase